MKEIHPSIWLLCDAPRRTGTYRKPEVVAYGHPPEVVMQALHALRPSGLDRLSLCILAPDHNAARIDKEQYKKLGFRYAGAEPLFVADLRTWTPPPPSSFIRRVTTPAEADLVKTAARSRQISPTDFASPTPVVRLYAAFVAEEPVGWVRSVTTHPDRAWVSNLVVRAESRRQGIGRNLIAAMQQDDASHGIHHSVLLASGAGARLYPHVGYTIHGVLSVFTAALG